ncbi:sulfatase-like hydrolase/transferase [Haliangium sp.]|uniref:sulfatase-like hydrolase/transferase n=1 Tax=Haliangium sp. TaxID=2663208 RepID=UPI003D0BF9E8
MTTAVFGGAVAGVATGAIDVLWSWQALDQFVSGAGKLRLLVYVLGLYGLLAGLGGGAGAALWAFFDRATRLGDLVRHARAAHHAARARNPGEAVAGLSLALAGVPVLAATVGGAYLSAVPLLATRKHFGLVVAVAMVACLGALGLGALITFALARPLELGLRALARRPGWARALSSPRAPALAVAGLVAVAASVAALMAWETLSLLPLRPALVALLALILAAPAMPIGARLNARAQALPVPGPGPVRAALAPALVALVLLTCALTAGRADGVRKAAGAYSGLGGPITRTLRRAVDLDRDGFSPILGGGDCDDWDRLIHPGGIEIPDDGLDQNCVGGDPSASPRSVDEVGFAAVPASVPRDLSVVLITIDTIRADHLGAYGYHRDTSPHIDAVAEDGALFVNGWAHAPSTRYSVPAILTGRWPLQVHYDTSIRGWPGLLDDNETVAEHMQRAGMYTGAVLNYWYFDPQRHMNQGFDYYDNQNQRYHRAVSGKGPAESQGSSSKHQTDKAVSFIDRAGGRRFFLWVHYYDPHYRYEPHPEVPSFGDDEVALYDGEIRYTDLHIGRLIEALKQRGLYQRTAIVITGDHGEGFGENGIDLHGYHLYAAQTKVPLIVRVPGLAPTRVTMPAAHADLVPTLVNLTRGRASAEMLGRSLVDVMSGQAAPDQDRWVFQQLSYENDNEKRAAISQRCHVIYNVSPDTSWELYRVDLDPLEGRDVIDDPGPCGDAREVLGAWYDRTELPAGAADALVPERPALAHPTPVSFGDEVVLLAAEWPSRPVRPGQQVEITYTFEARAPLDGGWKLFAHFEGPGRFLGDHEPPRPLSWWRAGQYIRYTHAVTVPAQARPGRYEVWMGLFRNNQRRPARSDAVEVRDDRALMGTLEVAP